MATTTAIKSVITEDQAQFARDHGFLSGADMGYKRHADLWVSESGCIHVYPSRKWDEIQCWVVAIFYRNSEGAPHTTRTYPTFKAAIAANA